jgi:hypothetical protein
MNEQRPRPRRGGGRKSKGERVSCTIRFPAAMHAEMLEAADGAGYSTLQDFAVDAIARALAAGLCLAQAQQQPRLPMSA